MEDKNILKEQLLYFMKENYKGYKRSRWEKTIDNIVSGFLRNIRKYGKVVELSNIESISITQNELNKIKEINKLDLDDLSKKNLEKICFIMLIYAKVSNEQLKSKESWINKSCSTILKEAKVYLIGDEKKRIFYQLYKFQYISQSNATEKTSMKINYIDVEEESDIVINIDNFEGVIYYYLNWNGENWKRCEGKVNGIKCNRYFKITINNKKYCNHCSKQIEKGNWVERKRKQREKEKCHEAIESTNTLI
jgi:hypothetical protein